MDNEKEIAFPSNVTEKIFNEKGELIGGSQYETGDLTKLEYASIAAMQGIISNWQDQISLAKINQENIAHAAITCAKELLKQLSENK